MSNKNKVVSNMIWRFAERCGAQGVAFIVSLVLARLLDPETYGIVALVTVFTAILQVFVDSGMANALIQKKNADDLDFSTAFYFNLTVCIVLYLGMFFAAPLIADFYNMPDLTPVVRVLSLTIVVSGVKNVQQAYVSRHLKFKLFFFATLGGTVGAAIIGIIMAYCGMGVWALVAQQLFNVILDTIILWITVKWRPKAMFSMERLKGLFGYGWKLLVSGLLDTVYNNVRQLIIGKFYSSADLAFFNKGKQFPNLIITNINTSIDSVLLPVISTAQDDLTRVKAMTRKAIKTSSFVIWPLVMGMAACAEPIVRILLTDKWLPCVFYLQIFCFTYGFWPVHTANLNAIKAVGRSDIFLKLEIQKKIIGVISILVALPFGVQAIAIAYGLTSPINALINSRPNRSLLNYGYREQIIDMLPSMLLSGFMGVVVYFMNWININIYILLLLQVIVGVAIYVGGAYIFKFESLSYIAQFAREKLKKGR